MLDNLRRYSSSTSRLTDLSDRCHYVPGSVLDLFFSTTYGSTSTVHKLSVDILRSFMPFTNAVTLLVRPTSSVVGKSLGLPDQFVAKLSDRRFIDRSGYKAQWSTSVESSFRDALEKIEAGERIPGNYFPRLGGRAESEPELEDLQDWMREMEWYELMMKVYNREITAYRYLQRLQGSDIPKFYGTFHILSNPTTEETPLSSPEQLDRPGLARSILDYVDGMAIEYIDGHTMAEVRPDIDVERAHIEKASELILQILHRIKVLGVQHGDVRKANTLIRRHHPHQPVVIDFGSAFFREPGESEDQWASTCRSNGELNAMRRFLSDAGLHIRSPPHQDSFKNGPYINSLVEHESVEWRERFLDPVPNPGYVMIKDLEGKDHQHQLPRWKLKPGVKTCDDERYNYN